MPIAALLIFLSPNGAAADTSNVSLPELGGQRGGAAAQGVGGLLSNPAVGDFVEDGEVFMDVGLFVTEGCYERAASSEGSYAPACSQSAVPHPYLGFAVRPFEGDIGERIVLGVALGVPFGRSGDFDPQGAQRHHVTDVRYFSVFATPILSVRIVDWLTLGVGVSYVHTRIERGTRLDLGQRLLRLDPGADPPPPLEDPFLESDLRLNGLVGHGVAWHAGVVLRPERTWHVGVGVQSATTITATGRSVLVPSRDLALESHADVTMTFGLPLIVHAGVRWQVEPSWSLGAEVRWTNWSASEAIQTRFSGSEIMGTNAELDALLAALGTDDLERLLNTEDRQYSGANDTVSGRLLTQVRLADEWQLNGLVGFDRHAVEERFVRPSKFDFDAVSLGLGIEWHVTGHWALSLSSTQYVLLPREISNSAFNPQASAESGLGGVSGNGRYSAFLNRTAVSVRFSWGGDEED